MRAFYNEIDRYCCDWLSNLMDAGLITPGKIDDRSIADLSPDDVRGYERVHLFAGIAGWELALNLAGWGDRLVWTGSCPCQPFSTAGKRWGIDDERHLWPAWFALIRRCRPAVIFGEQVASAEAIGRLDNQTADVPTLLDREAVFGVLSELKRQSERPMQGLSPLCGACSEAFSTRRGSGHAQSLADGAPRLCLGECGEAQSQDTRNPIRSRPGRNSGKNRKGRLRTDGHSVRSDDSAIMECPVFRPDNSWRWLHNEEHSGRSVRHQRDGEHMGRESYHRGCECDDGASAREIERLVSCHRQASERATDWLSIVRFDLGRAGYGFGACIAPAASVGAPHIRQRLWFVADSVRATSERRAGGVPGSEAPLCGAGNSDGHIAHRLADGCEAGDLGHPGGAGLAGRQGLRGHDGPQRQAAERAGGDVGELGIANSAGSFARDETTKAARYRRSVVPTNWDDCEWLYCRDGKWRPTQRGLFPLVDGLPGDLAYSRTAVLRAAGNAIVPQLAAEFIRASRAAIEGG